MQRVLDRLRLDLVLLELLGLGHVPAQPEPDEAEQAADHERDAPAPAVELVVGEAVGEDGAEHGGDQHRGAGGDVEERRVATAAFRRRDLREVGRGVGDLPAQRHALGDARQQQQDRGQPAHLAERRQERDDHRAAGHQRDRQQHRRLATAKVGEPAEQHAAERTEEEGQRIGGEGADERRGLVVRGEDLGGEVDRERRVDRPVVPLDRVAHAGGDQRAHRQLVRHLLLLGRAHVWLLRSRGPCNRAPRHTSETPDSSVRAARRISVRSDLHSRWPGGGVRRGVGRRGRRVHVRARRPRTPRARAARSPARTSRAPRRTG